MEVAFAGVLSRLFESGHGLRLEHLQLFADLIISYFIELFCFLVVHATLDEHGGRGLGGRELVEQEGGVGVQEEVPEVAFAVFVAHIADQVEVSVIVLCSDLL